MPRAPKITLLACACAGLLAGCGGAAKRQPPPSAYRAQASAICREQQAKLHGLQQPSTPAEAINYLPPALAVIHRETQLLGALEPPPAERQKLAAALTNARQLRGVLQHFLTQLHQGMVEFPVLVEVQAEGNTLRSQISRRFREAGLPACGV
jgi:hypothetical protein